MFIYIENKNANLHESNADIQYFSVFPKEKEILFFPGSSFIIKNIKNTKNDKIEITLNYNGKYKDNYSLIYENLDKLKELLKNNVLTKDLKYDNLSFLKNGKYLIGEKVGQGGFGLVIKAKNMETDEIVAIKKIYKNDAELNNIINNFKRLKIISEKIKYSCKYKDYFETDDYYYIVMSYYDDNLKNYLEHKEYLPPILINKIFRQLNETFKELLNNHIVHRDISPDNILIKYDDDNKINFDSVLSDYGISKFQNDEDILMREQVGKYKFMAPEIIEGKEYKNTCDLYSIGVTMYLLYFGRNPYDDLFFNNDISIIEEDKDLNDLVRKLLKKNPDERISWKEYFEHPFFTKCEY